MPEPEHPQLAEVGLFLSLGPMRDFDAGPRTRIGRVRFGGWQLEAHPSERYTENPYLVRVTFDIDLEPGVPGPRWAEVGFAFRTDGVYVLDAVPQSGAPDRGRLYTLTPALNFTEGRPDDPDGPAVQVTAEQEAVQAFGINDVAIRWRYTATGPAGVAPGTRTGWLVLLVPPETLSIEFLPLARYELPDEREMECITDAQPCMVALPPPPARRIGPGTRGGYSGQQKLAFVRQLGPDWADVADVLGVPTHAQNGFQKGSEPRDLWNWLDARGRLAELPNGLDDAGRSDLAVYLRGEGAG